MPGQCPWNKAWAFSQCVWSCLPNKDSEDRQGRMLPEERASCLLFLRRSQRLLRYRKGSVPGLFLPPYRIWTSEILIRFLSRSGPGCLFRCRSAYIGRKMLLARDQGQPPSGACCLEKSGRKHWWWFQYVSYSTRSQGEKAFHPRRIFQLWKTRTETECLRVRPETHWHSSSDGTTGNR